MLHYIFMKIITYFCKKQSLKTDMVYTLTHSRSHTGNFADLFTNNGNTTSGFSLFGTSFFSSILWILNKKSCPEGLNVVYLSEIMTTTLTLCVRIADITYYADADITLFLHVRSDRLSLTAAFFLHLFLAVYCFKCFFSSFSLCKTVLHPILYL